MRSADASAEKPQEKPHKKALGRAANIGIAVGIILILIPALLWLNERYYQWDQSKKWQGLVSAGSSSSIKSVRESEQQKAKKTGATIGGQASKTETDTAEAENKSGWSADMVDTSTVAIGASIAYIEIPKINVKESVLEGDTFTNLSKGAIRVVKTAKIGAIGTTLISGHRTMFGAPFHNLHLLNPGDKVIVFTKKAAFVYAVKDIRRVLPTDWSEIKKPTETSKLILSTCDPMYSAAKRLLIICDFESASWVKEAATAKAATKKIVIY